MPTNKQRRQAAQRHLQRQLERRAELAKKRRRNLGLLLTALAVIVVVGAALLITGVLGGDDDEKEDQAAGSSTPAATSSAARTTNPDGTVSCDYLPDDSGNPNLKDVGTPPTPEATPTQGTATVRMTTDQGDLTLTLDRAKAPCAAASFVYLTDQGFYDNTPCHRLVTQEQFGLLQCGDPTGTGSGGPSYKYAEEVTQDTTYPRGTIAMAKTQAPNSTGSQFFLCFTDVTLPPQYTVVGTIDEAGLAVLDKVGAGGVQGSDGPGDGTPNIPVTIKDMAVV
ncbi:peptidylprolyl isomerase [Blastococcus sp. TF02-8]|uniref:peptidylprolyl isomerase n=1 Tax=Blastococcus sp. TF02-8 TaxID=2250574 RepID=UPI000DEBB59F|nr:peptidylprolyl isomerase [Blastococcus sp. TF02-8]RBY93755.1 peptidylprolyl isomerase [Blastococcus sp. TF02-8]